MKRRPYVSIIIAVYKNDEYLRQCLDSAINQTLKNIEIVVVNDASPSQTIKILAEYDDERLKIITHKKNMGRSLSRDTGIANASGEYLIFLDSDDWVMPEMCEVVYSKAIEHDADMVAFDIEDVDILGNPIEKVANFDRKYIGQSPEFIENYFNPKEGKPNIYFSECNKMTKRSIYEENLLKHIAGIDAEDLIFVLHLIYYCNTIIYIPQAYYKYRQGNQNSITESLNPKWFLDMISATVEAYLFLKDKRMLTDKIEDDIIKYIYRPVKIFMVVVAKDLSFREYNSYLEKIIALVSKINLNALLELVKKDKGYFFLSSLIKATINNRNVKKYFIFVSIKTVYTIRYSRFINFLLSKIK